MTRVPIDPVHRKGGDSSPGPPSLYTRLASPETAVARPDALLHTHTRHARSAHRTLSARPVEFQALAFEAAAHAAHTKEEENARIERTAREEARIT